MSRAGSAGYSQGQRVSTTGQAVDLEVDQRALDDGEFAGVVDPRGTGGQARVDAIPGHGRAVPRTCR
ncbi:hypothetical protein OG960_45040 [Streptomyces sp. NBC_00280]